MAAKRTLFITTNWFFDKLVFSLYALSPCYA